MKQTISKILPIIFLTACSGGSGFSTDVEFSDSGTTDTDAEGSGGSEQIGGSGGTDSGGTDSGGTTSGGSGGTEAGGTAAGGSGGVATNCIPKTCTTIAVELNGGTGANSETGIEGSPEACGIVQDGCGNYIDCEGCNNSEMLDAVHSQCGSGPLHNNPTVENLCGVGCVKSGGDPGYNGCPSGTWFVNCNKTNVPPWNGCTKANGSSNTNYWCCDM